MTDCLCRTHICGLFVKTTGAIPKSYSTIFVRWNSSQERFLNPVSSCQASGISNLRQPQNGDKVAIKDSTQNMIDKAVARKLGAAFRFYGIKYEVTHVEFGLPPQFCFICKQKDPTFRLSLFMSHFFR